MTPVPTQVRRSRPLVTAVQIDDRPGQVRPAEQNPAYVLFHPIPAPRSPAHAPQRAPADHFLAEDRRVEAAGPRARRASPLSPIWRRSGGPHPQLGWVLALEPDGSNYSGMPCCAWPPRSISQQQPSRSVSVAPASELRARSSSESLAGDWAQPAASTGWWRLGHWPSADQAASRTIALNPAKLVVGGLYAGWGNARGCSRWLAPHWKRSIDELLARSPIAHCEIGPAGNGASPKPGTAQLPGGGAALQWRSPSASPLLGGTSKGKRLAEGLGGIATGTSGSSRRPGLPGRNRAAVSLSPDRGA